MSGRGFIRTVTQEEVQSRLAEIIGKLTPGEEVVLTRGDRPMAHLVTGPAEKLRTVPGRSKRILTFFAEDDDRLRMHFADYMA